MISIKNAAAKVLLATLALISLPAMATDTVLQLLQRDSKESGMHVAWELDFDFELNGEQVKALELVQKGDTGYLAGRAIDIVRKGAYDGLFAVAEKPVAFECPSLIVVVTTSEAGERLGKSCTRMSRL